MTATPPVATGPISTLHPAATETAGGWVNWFWADFLPAWALRANDPDGIGFFDVLDINAAPPQPDRKTILAQARLLFTFSHLALISDTSAYHTAAQAARDALPVFRKSTGLYCRAVARDGRLGRDTADQIATSYDQCFVILALSTWGRLHPSEDTAAELESCWAAIETHLVDPVTGLLLEHDAVADPADPAAPNRAQNPHMHLYEAALQAFEMTGLPVWLTRAQDMRAKGLEYFFDAETGTLTEFLTPDLAVLPARDGQRREIGHQCEWAWLLLREVELGGNPEIAKVAQRLLAFADRHGFAEGGVMQGAAFDAVSCDASWREETFLLWPQTEAIKTHAVRADDPAHAEAAKALVELVFRQYFGGQTAFVNQLDAQAKPLWPEALSRLHYHLVLALTEGARAGLWRNPG